MLISVSKEQPWLLAWRSELFLIASLPAPFASPSHLPASIRMALSGSPQFAKTDPLSGLAGTPTTSSLSSNFLLQSPPSCPSPFWLWAPGLHQLHDQVAAALSGYLYNRKTNTPGHTYLSPHAPPTRRSLTLTSRFYCRDDYRTRNKHQMWKFKKGQSWFTCKAGFLTIFPCKGKYWEYWRRPWATNRQSKTIWGF